MRLYSLLLLAPLFVWANPPSTEPVTKINYPANFQVEKGIDLFLWGDYLYWNTYADGLSYAREIKNGHRGSLKNVSPDYDNGLRVGLGFNFPKEGYEMSLSWTWVANTAHSHKKGTLFPLWTRSAIDPDSFASRIDSSWKLDFQLLDFTWGRASWFGGNFSLLPFAGLRGAHVRQHFSTQLSYLTVPVTQGHLTTQLDFEGGGLRAGAESRFTLPYGFAFYGIASGSLLYGRFDNDTKTRDQTVTIANTLDRFYQVAPSLQIGLGLGWDTHFAKDRLHIALHAGWEQNTWFGLNKMDHFVGSPEKGLFHEENGDLGLQGVVAGGRLDF